MPRDSTMPPPSPQPEETELEAVEAEPELPGERRVYLVLGGEGRSIELATGEAVTFGRTGEVTVAIEDSRVSRLHARISRRGDEVLVEDLGSRNGTRLGGVLLRSEGRRAVGGDVVRVGPTEIVIATATAHTAEPLARLPPDPDAASEDDAIDRSPRVVVADPKMRKVFQVARRVGRTQTTVLVTGETGVGKEVVAEEIHRASPRARGPFVRLSCASLSESILESELFGHERGAFTGADRRRVGYFEAAAGGTLLLDEVGELSPRTQAKLLLVLENRTITRVGGTAEIPVDVRVVCATHRDLQADVAAGRFREDLFYRMSAFSLEVPPLRERPTEIALLVELFAREFAERIGEPPARPSDDARSVLGAYRWPGNVRELRNAIEHAVVLAEGGVIRPEHLPASVQGAGGAATTAGAPSGELRAHIAGVERRNIEAALAAEKGNQTRAAQRLGISRRALIYKMAKYGIGR